MLKTGQDWSGLELRKRIRLVVRKDLIILPTLCFLLLVRVEMNP